MSDAIEMARYVALTRTAKVHISVLVLLSVLLVVGIVVWYAVRFVAALRRKYFRSHNLGCLILIICSVWCLRYAVGFYTTVTDITDLTLAEEFFNSFIHTLQSFSMDESYTDYILTGKEMIAALMGAGSPWVNVFGVYTAMMNVVTPICGGAVILTVLQRVFPKTRLFFQKGCFWKEKYYFSELNEASIMCAENLVKRAKNRFKRPVIVFTDTYTNPDVESSAELRKRADMLGAVCIDEDITELKHRHVNKKEYWLIDENELDNIKTLAKLSDGEHCRNMRGTVIRIFYQNDSYAWTERDLSNRLIKYFYTEPSERMVKRATACRFRYLMQCAMKNAAQIKSQQQSEQPEKKKAPAKKQSGTKRQDRKARIFDEFVKLLKQELGEEEHYIAPKTYAEAKARLYDNSKSNLTHKRFIDRDDDGADADRIRLNKKLRRTAGLADIPAVIRVRCYQNIIWMLLRDEPLYTPLLTESNPTELNIAIFGNGIIGMEMLLSSYWCGQMLDIALSVNMVSKDDEKTACAKINQVNTDILNSTQKENSMLAVYPTKDSKCNDPYFTFRYHEADVDYDSIDTITCTVPHGYENQQLKKEMNILDADYFLVALGSDDSNIRAAERLYRFIAGRQLERKSPKSVTIAYVVYNPDLCASIDWAGDSEWEKNIHMVAIGSVRDMYSYDTICLSSMQSGVKQIHKQYEELRHSQWVHMNRQRIDNPYNYWSTVAKYIHKPYMAFSCYQYLKRNQPEMDEWKIWSESHKDNAYLCETRTDKPAEQLAWLEHRRWNAYMRATGFRYGETKIIPLKVHNCLVETKRCAADSAMEDRLDRISKETKYKDYDYDGIAPVSDNSSDPAAHTPECAEAATVCASPTDTAANTP